MMQLCCCTCLHHCLPAVMCAQTLSGPSALGLSPHSLPLAADSTTASLHTAAPMTYIVAAVIFHTYVCAQLTAGQTTIGAEAEGCWSWESVSDWAHLKGLGTGRGSTVTTTEPAASTQ